MTGAPGRGPPHPRSRQRGRFRRQGAAGRGPARGSPRAVCRTGRPSSAARRADRVPLPARRRRGRRSRAGRAGQGLLAPVVVSRGAAVRGLVHAHPDQRMPGSHQGADTAGAMAGADAGVAAPASATLPSACAGAVHRRRIRCSAGSAAETGGGVVAAAGTSAVGVHAEPLRGLHVARSQRADGAERVDGSRAPVSGDSPSADAARRRFTGIGMGRERRRVTS